MKKDIRPGQFIYSYGYEEAENWSRVDVSDEDRQLRFEQFMKDDAVVAEITKTASSIADIITASSSKEEAGSMSEKLVFTVLSDTHYVKNGNWEYTAATIEAVNDAVYEKCGRRPDGIIHLGDFTDGMLTKDICRDYSHRIIDRMAGWNVPVYLCTGNHDSNYFKGNPEAMNLKEQYEMYFSEVLDMDSEMNQEVHVWSTEDSNGEFIPKLYYRVDVPDKHLVIFALDAYDNSEKNRYGFTLEEVEWIGGELENVPEDSRVLIISHDAPLEKLDFWAKEIRNGEALCDVLDAWNIEHDHRILAFLHGHTHADRIFYDRSFPIVSVGCSKIEYFEDKKPFGAIAPVRYEDDVTQELWDTLIVDTSNGELNFVRFGAGFDRFVPGTDVLEKQDAKRYRCMSKLVEHPYVWAHRGASGYAPENTIESFILASTLGADGIELDVQFTKDREIVVIHDERIDRTSSGKGYVADMTLAELRKYNFNNKMIDMPWCNIPTFREVLEIVKPTRMVINIELKTSINHYPGLEEAVINLVDEYDMSDRVIYSSFSHDSVMRVKKLRPEAECGLLYNIGIADAAKYAKDHGIEALHPWVGSMNYPGFIEECREYGIKINTWTANRFTEIEQMRQYGVNALITNYPDKARELFEKVDLTRIIDYFKIEMINRIVEDEKNGAHLDAENVSRSNSAKKHSPVVHAVGVIYGKIKKTCIKIDDKVQKMAGYR